MPCDRKLKKNQTLQERAEEVRRAALSLDRGLINKTIKPVIGPQGAIAFVGWSEQDRNSVTDACAYRRIMASGTALARAEIARAEAMAGRTVNKQVIGQGAHSHDNGETWHDHK